MREFDILPKEGKMKKSFFAKGVALCLAMSVGWVASGCFGKFQLTRKLYDINKSVDEKFTRSAVTWLFVIIPVYGVTALLDFFVFNVIEFWSGENPVAEGPSTKVYVRADESVVMSMEREGGATVATIARYKGRTLLSTLRIRDEGKGIVTSDLSVPGRETVRRNAALLPDGSVEVVTLSPSWSGVERHAPTVVETYIARAQRIALEGGRGLPGGGGAGPLAAPARVPALQG